MSMIMNYHLFNDSSLNIFTDGSIRKLSITPQLKETIGCAGAYATTSTSAFNQVQKSCSVIRNATNNITELMAIYEGLCLAQQHRNHFKTINIISDSKINIFGLREWIFNWIIPGIPELRSSSGNPPQNVQYIMQIIYFILNNNLHVHFYHINGHKNFKSQKDLNEAYKTFKESNHIQSDIDIELIKNLCIGNDIVDVFTGIIIEQKLQGIHNNPVYYVPTNVDPDKVGNWELPKVAPKPLIEFIYKPFDTNKYKNLIYQR